MGEREGGMGEPERGRGKGAVMIRRQGGELREESNWGDDARLA